MGGRVVRRFRMFELSTAGADTSLRGLLVPPSDPSALATGLSRMIMADRGWRTSLGDAGRRRVEERFSVRRMAERTMAVYDELGH